MATFQIMHNEGNYLQVAVIFGEYSFLQTIYTEKTGDELTQQLTEYAEDYEAEYMQIIAAQNQEIAESNQEEHF